MSPDDLFDQVVSVLATRPYYPCVLLVHADVRRLLEAAAGLAARSGWPEFAVSRVLADALVGASIAQRSSLVTDCLNRPLARLRPGPVLCTDLALLFEPALAVDPLVLLRQWSRSIPLVACWPGRVEEDVLAYAVPAHAHYRTWRDTQLGRGCIIML